MKSAAGARGVAKHEKHWLAVRQTAFGNFVDLVRYSGRFVKNVERCGARRVLASEGFGIVLFAGLRRAEPRFLELLLIHALARYLEPRACNTTLRPSLNCGPGTCTQLLKRVRRDRPLRVFPCRHNPIHDERD